MFDCRISRKDRHVFLMRLTNETTDWMSPFDVNDTKGQACFVDCILMPALRPGPTKLDRHLEKGQACLIDAPQERTGIFFLMRLINETTDWMSPFDACRWCQGVDVVRPSYECSTDSTRPLWRRLKQVYGSWTKNRVKERDAINSEMRQKLPNRGLHRGIESFCRSVRLSAPRDLHRQRIRQSP